MKCQNNMVIAALVGVVVGTLIGAGTAQYAQLVAYQGTNPEAARQMESIRWLESDDPNYKEKIAAPEVQQPSARETMRSAAPSDKIPEHCRQYKMGGQRYAKCVVEARENDVRYQPQQTTRQ